MKKTILIFSDWYYPAYKAGGPVRSLYNLALTLKEDFEVKVICSNKDLNSSEELPGIKSNEWVKLHDSHHVWYASENYKNLIKQNIKENKDNVLLINGIFSFKFSILPVWFSLIFSAKKVYVAPRGMLHKSALGVKSKKKNIFLAFVKGLGLYNHVHFLATNEEEKQQISSVIPKVPVLIAPNIPDLIIPAAHSKIKSPELLKILFLGRIAPEKNPMLLLEAVSEISANLQIQFAGSYSESSEYYKRLISYLEKIPSHVEVKILGEVQHQDVPQLLSEVDVMILPSLGENFGHSIYESLANSVPVVIGNNTPWKGLENQKAGFEIEQNSEQLRELIQKIYEMSPEEWNQWRKSAADYAQNYLNSHNFREHYINLFS